MITRIATISLTLFLFLSLGCKKDQVPCTTCPTGGGAGCEDIQNVKHFFYFKVGSWWVYEEENSGLRDSVYVTSAAENPSNYDFDVEVYSTYQDYYYRFWPQYGAAVGSTCSPTGQSCGWCAKVFRSKYKPGDFVGQATCFIFQPVEGASDVNPNNSYANNRVYVDEALDSIEMNSYMFQRTVKMYENQTYMEGDQPTNHYFSENVGLIKKELLDSNQVWNLVDYHIEP
jgi:hypothetical protein